VRSTGNLVLEYHGRLADPYFTADCGGETEAAANLWPDGGQPYLVSFPDPYCAAGLHSSWQREIPLDRVARILRNGMGLRGRGPVRDLTVASRDSSGRAHTLEVLAGSRFLIDANQFHYAVGRELGWDILKSNIYAVERSGETLVFNGRGLGHGVGLCQAGADAMAGLLALATGKSWRTIFPARQCANLRRRRNLIQTRLHPANISHWSTRKLRNRGSAAH